MNILAHPDLSAARRRMAAAVGRKDKIAVAEAAFDHRNLLREVVPALHFAWRQCMQRQLEMAFNGAKQNG